MDETIKKYYDDYNYPKLDKLDKLMISDGVAEKKKDIGLYKQMKMLI